MDKLIAELERLYFLPGQADSCLVAESVSGPDTGSAAASGVQRGREALARSLGGIGAAAIDPVGPDGRVRTLAMDFKRSGDWEAVAELYRRVQDELELPAPALSISATGGYRLWFSLAEPVTVEEARNFLAALDRQYLEAVPASGLGFHPGDGLAAIDLVHALDPATGTWSAFIDPGMGSMFIGEPGLEMAPNLDRQADLLAGFASVKAVDFQRALNQLLVPAGAQQQAGAVSGDSVLQRQRTGGGRGGRLNVGGGFADPKSFLLAVMNDAAASPRHRIAAAKALLPYFDKDAPPS